MYSQVVRLAAAPGVVGSARRVSLVVPVSSNVPDGGYVNLAWYNATACSWVRLCTSTYDAASFSATVGGLPLLSRHEECQKQSTYSVPLP